MECKRASEAIAECYESGKHSDLIIQCRGSYEFKVHKMIMCPQSEFFAEAVENGRFKEGQTDIVELPEDDPFAVQAMLGFFYFEEYELPENKKANHGTSSAGLSESEANNQLHPMLLHLAVYELADRVRHMGLKANSEKQFQEAAEDAWDKPEFLQAKKKVYDTSPPNDHGVKLRNVVLKIAAEHYDVLLENEAFVDVLREVNDFSVDLHITHGQGLGSKDEVPSEHRPFLCSRCGSKFRLEDCETSTKRTKNVTTTFCPKSISEASPRLQKRRKL